MGSRQRYVIFQKMHITICCDWCKLHQQTIAWKFFSNSSNFHTSASSLKFTPFKESYRNFLSYNFRFVTLDLLTISLDIHITFFYLAKLLLMKAVTNAFPPFMQQSSFQGKGSFGQRYVVQKMHITSTFIGASGASSINKV